MKSSEYDALIAYLDKLATSEPEAYRARVHNLLRLGYFYIHGLALLLLVLLTAAVLWLFSGVAWWGKLFLLICFLAWLLYQVARSIVLRLPPPEGVRLVPKLHPLLFSDIREVRQKMQAPKFHQILFNMDINAAVTEHPRFFGLLGRSNYLMIGIPLLMLLSRDEFKAVLAHELGHISKRHSKIGRSVYLLQSTLLRLHERLSHSTRGILQNPLDGLLDKYLKVFHAHALPLRRQNEFEADRLGAEAMTAGLAARALCKITAVAHVLGLSLEEETKANITQNRHPNMSWLKFIRGKVQSNGFRAETNRWLARLQTHETEPSESHPSLKDRLQALLEKPLLLWDQPETAARAYFGRDHDRILEQLDQLWLQNITPRWNFQHDLQQLELQEIARLNHLRQQEEKLTIGESITIPKITESCYGSQLARASWKKFTEEFPELSHGHYHLGRILHLIRDKEAYPHLEFVAERDPFYAEHCYYMLIERALEENDAARVAQWKNYLWNFQHAREAIFQERTTLSPSDVFHPVSIEKSVRDTLYAACVRASPIRKLFVLGKTVTYFAEWPVHVLVYQMGWGFRLDLLRQERVATYLENHAALPGTILSIPLNSQHSFLQKYLRAHPEAELFSSNDK